MTTSTRLGLVIDATIATLTAALPSRVVYDGPQFVPGDVQNWCIVGGDGQLDDEPRTAGIEHTWAGLGARAQDEGIDVQCALVSWSGDEGPFKTVRDAVINDLALLEASLINSITQGVPGVLWCQITAGELFQSNTDMGPRARLPFTIHARNRI